MNISKYAFITVFLCVCTFSYGQEENRDTKQHPELNNLVINWASKLGGELWHFGELVTRKNKVKDSFKDTTVVAEDGESLLKTIHENISNMMKQKVEAVKRIMDIAEQAAQAQKDSDIDINFSFYNAKNLTDLNEIPPPTTTKEPEIEPQEVRDDSFIPSDAFGEYQPKLEELDVYQRDQADSPEESSSKDDENNDGEPEGTEGPEKDPQASQTQQIDKSKLSLVKDRNFYYIPVNINHSVVHVPSNVYERSKEVIAGIKWSEELDKTFRNNYKLDPTLSWQYFGSSTGFMRYFPAMIWSQEPMDLFDTRTRSWYIEAASSPKDIVILVDRSGSMTGMRREIARHVVHNLLDTLGNNDYVNIFTFSNTTEPLVECFENRLVQANLANIRMFKESMGNFKTEQIANFSLALITAFELLNATKNVYKQGAQCNQAIMLITDGVQDNYKEVFQKYNWAELPYVSVRVFTYLIGREVSDVREVKWMACANQGYYVHLSTYAEVREEVLHYIPVMARPMVLNPSQKPNPTWSPVYADVTDPKLTNWLWVNRARDRQRERYKGWEKLKAIMKRESGQEDMRFVKNIKEFFLDLKPTYKDPETQAYHLMTSVSLPVYDKRPRQNITEKIQVNEALWITVTREERVANLLGVAGTDVPLEQILRLMVPYRLGVNGYAFIVTNNGYILTHPDLRPVYQGILKPAFNRVDLVEIEILDDDSDPRNFSEIITEFRNKIIMQGKGNSTFRVKQHIDDMKRIMVMTRKYYYMGLNGTPFSLVISLPHKYGHNRIQHPVENDIHRIRSNDRRSLREYFNGSWTIHPDWHYCRYLDNREHFKSPEDEFMHFLEKIEEPGWKWSKECDRKLICKLVADAKITDWFNQNITTSSREEKGTELVKKIGIVVAFLATHSGLTRWQNFPQNLDEMPNYKPNFERVHNRAIDEIWYQRAVEQHYIDPNNYVYSVPHEIGDSTETLVTVSHAIFKEETNRKAPVAVVGYQFFHSALHSLFTKITSNCGDIPCKRTCESEELHCLILDDSGFVIVSDNPHETGMFFGKIRGDIMSQLVETGIYKVTTMYDYQGLCTEDQDSSSPASTLLTPIVHLKNLLSWLASTIIFLGRTILGEQGLGPIVTDAEHIPGHINSQPDLLDSGVEADVKRIPDSDTELIMRFSINKTKPEPCDNQLYLYSLIHYTDRNVSNSGYNKSMVDCMRPYIVQRVIYSNMILLVINKLCRENEDIVAESPDPVQIDYNMSLACYRVLNNDFPRRIYMSCINRANESEIKLCGNGVKISPINYLLAMMLIFNLYFCLF